MLENKAGSFNGNYVFLTLHDLYIEFKGENVRVIQAAKIIALSVAFI